MNTVNLRYINNTLELFEHLGIHKSTITAVLLLISLWLSSHLNYLIIVQYLFCINCANIKIREYLHSDIEELLKKNKIKYFTVAFSIML